LSGESSPTGVINPCSIESAMESSLQIVDFVVRGLDDQGKPSQMLLEVVEAAVVDERNRVLGRFRDADSLGKFLTGARGRLRLIALETVGLPRLDLSGKFVCYEQALDGTLVEKRRQ